MTIGAMLEPMGLAAGPLFRRANGANSMPRLMARRLRRCIRSTRPRIREFQTAGSPVVGSGPVGHDGTEAWLEAIGDSCNVSREKIDAAKNMFCRRSRPFLPRRP
jgi:3,8-divinyl chlorophyllide a/chlorophyllide a reductase subunit Y